MKARAIQLVVIVMAAEGAPDWAVDATYERLHQFSFWHDWLTIVNYTPAPRGLWSGTETQKRNLHNLLAEHGREYWTVALGDILAEELLEQLEKFRKRPAMFGFRHPAPREATLKP